MLSLLKCSEDRKVQNYSWSFQITFFIIFKYKFIKHTFTQEPLTEIQNTSSKKYEFTNMLGKHMLFVYSTLRHGQEVHTVICRVLTTLDTMFVILESSIIMVVVLAFALIIVTVDCDGSMYDVRKRTLWDVNDISNLIRSTRVVQEFDSRLQTNHENRDVDAQKLAHQLKYPLGVVNEANTIDMLIFATTCYEYFVDVLVEYINVVTALIVTSEVQPIDQKTIELIQFVDDDIYCLPTFLFDVGHRKLESILQTIHLLRLLSYSSQASLVTASVLKETLQKFVTDHSWKPMKNKAKSEVSYIDTERLIHGCLDIKRKLTKISKIFCLKSTPFINSHIYDQHIGYHTKLPFFSYRYYFYETENCTVYVSITNVFLVLYAQLARIF